MVAKDFNILSSMDERLSGATPRLAKIEEFNAALQSCGLSPIDFDGARYTSTNGRVWQRLDRALTNSSWIDAYDNFHISYLARGRSDYCSLFIREKEYRDSIC